MVAKSNISKWLNSLLLGIKEKFYGKNIISIIVLSIIIIVTEMFIGTNVGLGYYIINTQIVYRVPEMYAGIVLTGFIGYRANLILLFAQKRVLHWVGK